MAFLSLLSCSVGLNAQQLSPKSPLIRKTYQAPTSTDLSSRARIVLSHPIQIPGVAGVVTPAAPYIAGLAYLRASTTGDVLEFAAISSALELALGNGGSTLQVFIHGSPGKLTVVDCSVTAPGRLSATVSGGPDANHLLPDPQKRTLPATIQGEHYLFVVPADVPSISPSNWFSVNLQAAAGSGSAYTTIYGCSIAFES